MVNHRFDETVAVMFNNLAIKRIYKGSRVVWEKRDNISCFGAGYWINGLPWVNGDSWLNG